ncbi:MAG: hypothetical protein Q4G43_10305 [Mobilicoccus sp.]|nr:hypothetical protein [Mobilicoccus sp.]
MTVVLAAMVLGACGGGPKPLTVKGDGSGPSIGWEQVVTRHTDECWTTPAWEEPSQLAVVFWARGTRIGDDGHLILPDGSLVTSGDVVGTLGLMKPLKDWPETEEEVRDTCGDLAVTDVAPALDPKVVSP